MMRIASREATIQAGEDRGTSTLSAKNIDSAHIIIPQLSKNPGRSRILLLIAATELCRAFGVELHMSGLGPEVLQAALAQFGQIVPLTDRIQTSLKAKLAADPAGRFEVVLQFRHREGTNTRERQERALARGMVLLEQTAVPPERIGRSMRTSSAIVASLTGEEIAKIAASDDVRNISENGRP